MKRIKSLTYFPEQKKQTWGKYKVERGEDIYTSDSLTDCILFADMLKSMGFYPCGPKFSDPLDYFKNMEPEFQEIVEKRFWDMV